jgi:hypothetical protein
VNYLSSLMHMYKSQGSLDIRRMFRLRVWPTKRILIKSLHFRNLLIYYLITLHFKQLIFSQDGQLKTSSPVANTNSPEQLVAAHLMENILYLFCFDQH